MALLQCCSKRDMNEIFFGATSNQAFREAAKGRKEGDCQWCFELTQHFTVGTSTTWMCDNCKGLSEPCEECRAMVRMGATRRNNSKHCARCTKSFKRLAHSKAKFIRATRTLDQLRTDLNRKSEYRTNAARAGSLRAFLHLVALLPVHRMQIAINLGWTMITEENFGDAHFESWDIISRKGLGMIDRCKTWKFKFSPWAKSPNWYTILEKLCQDYCVPSYMNWGEEFQSPKLSKSEANEECNSASSPALSRLEMEFLTKISKHQRSRMSSLQACCLAELKSSEPVRRLLSLPVLQSAEARELVMYAMDGAYMTLARRDGSDGTGQVVAENFVAEVAAFASGVCRGEEELFQSAIAAVDRDTAPPGSILNSNASFFWLTIDMLDVEFCSDSGRLLPAVLQMLLQRSRLLLHGIKIESFMGNDFAEN